MLLSENYDASKLAVFICIVEHFPSYTDNTTRQLARVIAKAMLIATFVHYRCTHIRFAAVEPSLSPLTPCIHIFHIHSSSKV